MITKDCILICYIICDVPQEKSVSKDVIDKIQDPSVVNTQRQQPTLDDYNPFDQQQQQQQTQPPPPQAPMPQPFSQPSTYTPATLEPAQSETQQTFQSKPFGGGSGGNDINQQRQDELEKKAAELERREQELRERQAAGGTNNNFPPLPGFCPIKPCFYHDINVEIPNAAQTTCRMLFYLWQSCPSRHNRIHALYQNIDVTVLLDCSVYVLTLLMNLLTSLAYFVTGGGSGGSTFGTSILYFVVNIPFSFLCWYRPIYKALRSDSSFNYMLFFFVFFCQIIFSIIMAIGIPGVSIGWINGAQYFDENEGVAVMCMITAILWTLTALFKVLILKKVHTSYRSSGASFEKAQGEFAHGVASNKEVQKAAAQAVKEGAARY